MCSQLNHFTATLRNTGLPETSVNCRNLFFEQHSNINNGTAVLCNEIQNLATETLKGLLITHAH